MESANNTNALEALVIVENVTDTEKHFTLKMADIHPDFNHNLVGVIEEEEPGNFYAIYGNELYSDHKPDEKYFSTFEAARAWILQKITSDVKRTLEVTNKYRVYPPVVRPEILKEIG